MLNEMNIGETSVFGSGMVGEREFRDKNSTFKIKLGEEAKLLNRSNVALPAKIVVILDHFIVLSTDRGRSSIGFFQKLKLYWNLLK